MAIEISIPNITTVQITDANYDSTNTGVFDVLMEAVNLQIGKQWELGRLEGTDYANVYLGVMQTVLQESIKFALTSEAAGLQADEVLADTVRKDAESQEKVNSEVKNNEVDGVIDRQIAKLIAETLLTEQKKTSETTNTISATGGSAKDKSDLMAAQALGFANNSKQAVLKTMLEGYVTNLAVAGVANVPEATRDGAIDQLTQNILDSLTNTNTPARVVIQTVPEGPDVDTGV